MSSSAAIATRMSPPYDDGRTAGLSPRERHECRHPAPENHPPKTLFTTKNENEKVDKEIKTTTKNYD